jgi:ADP-dependent phosphofructokinase/glucokinase
MKLLFLLPLAFFALSFTCSAQSGSSVLKVSLKSAAGSELNIEEMKKGNFSIEYRLNGKKIDANWLSYSAILIPATGEMNPPINCSLGDTYSSAKDYLQSLKISKGDILILENVVVQYEGRKYETKKELEIHF